MDFGHLPAQVSEHSGGMEVVVGQNYGTVTDRKEGEWKRMQVSRQDCSLNPNPLLILDPPAEILIDLC